MRSSLVAFERAAGRVHPLAQAPQRASIGGHDPPDAAAVVAEAQVGAVFQLVGHEVGVLDDAAVHIDDVQRTVGAELQVDRAEPFVGRGEELLAFVGGLADVNVGPAGCMISRWTRLPVGSQVKALPLNSAGNRSPR